MARLTSVPLSAPTSPAHTLILSSGIIAEVEAGAADSDSIMVRAGDLICPCALAPPRSICPAAHGSTAPVFGARSRFWSVESLLQGGAAAGPPPNSPGPALQSHSFYVFAAACGVAAACVIWAKCGK